MEFFNIHRPSTTGEQTLKDFLRAAAPRYRKHKVLVHPTTAVTGMTHFWDGGSCPHYSLLHFPSGKPAAGMPPIPGAPPQFGGGEPAKVDLVPGLAVLSLGVFRGKSGTATIYMHPEDAAALGLDREDY